MVIFKMLLFTLLVLVLVPVFKLGVAIFRAYRHVKRQSAAFAGNSDSGYSSGREEPRGFREKRNTRRSGSRKIFRSDEGEYVRFEEVDVDIVQEQERRRRYGTATYRTEEQVSDAEWTEIKN